MIRVLLVLHVFVTVALIGVVLIQRSEGGGLGLGGGQGMGNFMTGRGTANLLTRTTAILGTAFFVLSLGLALLYKGTTTDNAAAILNAPGPVQSSVPVRGWRVAANRTAAAADAGGCAAAAFGASTYRSCPSGPRAGRARARESFRPENELSGSSFCCDSCMIGFH